MSGACGADLLKCRARAETVVFLSAPRDSSRLHGCRRGIESLRHLRLRRQRPQDILSHMLCSLRRLARSNESAPLGADNLCSAHHVLPAVRVRRSWACVGTVPRQRASSAAPRSKAGRLITRIPDHARGYGVQVRLDRMRLRRPRQWGACWLACVLYAQLGLDEFWSRRLPNSREGTRWRDILQTLVCYRLIDPGSEWRLHRLWFEQSAMRNLLGADYALVEKNALYRCLDKVLPYKAELFGHLRQRWQDPLGARFDILLYDLTSTYFESDPPTDEADKRRHGYSRDKRSDCVQGVIALIVTPEGFPLAYEVCRRGTPPTARRCALSCARSRRADARETENRPALFESRRRQGCRSVVDHVHRPAALGSDGEIVRDDARSSPPCRRRPWRRPRTYTRLPSYARNCAFRRNDRRPIAY